VVAWTAHKTLGPNPTDPQEHQVNFATYDPEFGGFVWSYIPWQVGYLDKSSPEVLRVKNGVVSWPMNDAITGHCSDMSHVVVYFAIYDHELHGWSYTSFTLTGWKSYLVALTFDWIEIVDDTTYVKARFSDRGLVYGPQDTYFMYDPGSHSWDHQASFDPSLCRRAYGAVVPGRGVVPFRVWFWDCSFALDGINNPSSWLWQLTPGGAALTDRNSSFICTDPGQYTITETVFYGASPTAYSAEGHQINAQAPAPPSGGISINNGAT
jgi:hypothetical protein